jgi:hypothetical protein
MRMEFARTFPIGRNRGYEFMRDMTQWSMWTPLEIGDNEDSFTFTPMKGVGITGSMTVAEEVLHETCSFVFIPRGFPEVDVRCTFDHAGPGAFTLRMFLTTETPAWTDKLMEMATFMPFTLRMAVRRSLDRLEHHFLGDLETFEEKQPALAE